ncbi:DNA-binding protein [Pseudoalteromonas sp. SG44-17]|uniref:helix-turn-helix domain-containing transcriptional regulator n=1 Tax=Pseudoalteromonas sp. SG44-17 TaxID=2760963 RepID=UPI003857BACB
MIGSFLWVTPFRSLVKNGVSDIAKAAGLNREGSYKAVNGKTKTRCETFFQVIKALNFRLTTQVA